MWHWHYLEYINDTNNPINRSPAKINPAKYNTNKKKISKISITDTTYKLTKCYTDNK